MGNGMQIFYYQTEEGEQWCYRPYPENISEFETSTPKSQQPKKEFRDDKLRDQVSNLTLKSESHKSEIDLLREELNALKQKMNEMESSKNKIIDTEKESTCDGKSALDYDSFDGDSFGSYHSVHADAALNL